jgi:Protein of unknown function (DUF3987)
MVQPLIAEGFFSDQDLLQQGLTSRFLPTAPVTTAGTRMGHDPHPDSAGHIKRYGAILLDLLERPLPLVEGKLNELNPRLLPLSPGVEDLWRGFRDSIEPQLAPGGDLLPIVSLANKLPEHASRLAAIRTVIEDFDAVAVSDERFYDCIRISEHFAAEALRLFESGQTNPDLVLAHKLLTWLHTKWREKEPSGLVTPCNVYQFGPGAIRDKDSANRGIDILVDHGWLVRIEGGAKVDGFFRRDAFMTVG